MQRDKIQSNSKDIIYYIQSIQQFVGFVFSSHLLFKIKLNEETMAKTQETDIKSESFSTYMWTAMTERKETTWVRMKAAQNRTFNEMIDD